MDEQKGTKVLNWDGFIVCQSSTHDSTAVSKFRDLSIHSLLNRPHFGPDLGGDALEMKGIGVGFLMGGLLRTFVILIS